MTQKGSTTLPLIIFVLTLGIGVAQFYLRDGLETRPSPEAWDFGIYSPTKRLLITAPDDEGGSRSGLSQHLWVIDLVDKKSYLMARLSDDMTFNKNIAGKKASFNISLKQEPDRQVIEADVYDNSVLAIPGEQDKPFIHPLAHKLFSDIPLDSTFPEFPIASDAKRFDWAPPQTVECNDKKYALELIEKDDVFYTQIYKDEVAEANFIARLWSPRIAFTILAASKIDCDRIYLTTVRISTDAPLSRIYEWRAGDKTFLPRELAISSEFASDYVKWPFAEKRWLSPDAERVVVAQYDEICKYRTLKLLNLREDSAEVLVRLPESEIFDGGQSEIGGCSLGSEFGWLNDETVYYDVYGAAQGAPYQFIERRTLRVD